jgi:hypothetical protein
LRRAVKNEGETACGEGERLRGERSGKRCTGNEDVIIRTTF